MNGREDIVYSCLPEMRIEAYCIEIFMEISLPSERIRAQTNLEDDGRQRLPRATGNRKRATMAASGNMANPRGLIRKHFERSVHLSPLKV